MHFAQRPEKATQQAGGDGQIIEAQDLNVVELYSMRVEHMLHIILYTIQINVAKFERFALDVPQDELLDEVDVGELLILQAELRDIILTLKGAVGSLLREVLKNLLLDQNVLSTLIVDVLDDLRADVRVLLEIQALNRHILLGILQQRGAVLDTEPILRQVEHAQVLAPTEENVVDLVPSDAIFTEVKCADLAS